MSERDDESSPLLSSSPLLAQGAPEPRRYSERATSFDGTEYTHQQDFLLSADNALAAGTGAAMSTRAYQNADQVHGSSQLSDGGESTSKPEYEGKLQKSTFCENLGKAGKVVFVVVMICVLSLLLVAGTTSASFRTSISGLFGSLYGSLKQSYYNARHRNSDADSSGTDAAVADLSDDLYWVNYTAPIDTQDFDIVRRGYASLPYWGYSSSDVIKYQFLKKYDALIEPNGHMHMMYNGHGQIDDPDDPSGDYYSFTILDSAGEVATDEAVNYYYPTQTRYKKDSTFNISCQPFDVFRIDVDRYNISGDIMHSFEWSAVCMYVRRELRSLTDGDLNATMDAMYAMWQYGDAEGQAMYGDNYHSAAWFAQLHDYNAAWLDGDHIHEGLGFLPQHIKMSNLFEASMQAVDPSVTLFYWDFTVESTNGASLFNSPMFADNSFGALPYSSKHGEGSSKEWSWAYDNVASAYIPDGRWAGTAAGENVFDDLETPFGYLRGPWNTNPGSKITRFSSDDIMSENIPSCHVYHTWLQETDWNLFMQTSENAPHASLHGSIGGIYGCDVLDELYDMGYVGTNPEDPDGGDYREEICNKWPFYMKELYRADILSSETGCTVDDSLSWKGTKCGYICNPDRVDDLGDILQGLSLANYVSNSSDPVLWTAYSDFICTGNAYRIFSGDHLESASPADPSFWPIHPTQERLYHAKLFAGGFLANTSTWPTETGVPLLGYEWVCNHAECYNYTDTHAAKDFYPMCCEGHFEDDQLFDFTKDDRTYKYGLTNRQILLDTDPTSDDYAVTYIYDNFDWKHCSDQTAYDLKSEIAVLYESSLLWEQNSMDAEV